MRRVCIISGVLGCVVACSADGGPAELTNSSSPPQRDGGRDSNSTSEDTDPSRDTRRETNSESSSSPSPSTSGTTAAHSSNTDDESSDNSTSVTTDRSCDNECIVDAVRCLVGETSGVRQCVVNEATGCTHWNAVDDCDHQCLSALLDDACDPNGPNVRCAEEGLVLCAPDAAGCPVWQSPNADAMTRGDFDIDDGATAFGGYGVLDVKLTGEVELEGVVACLTDLREGAVSTDSPAVSKINITRPDSLQLELSRYHLPIAYELAIAVGTPPAVRLTVLEPDTRSRVAFISEARGDGNLAAWTAAEDNPLDAADSICQTEAEKAGLSGSFRAYLSVVGESDALCRLSGAGGLSADECGPEQLLSELDLTAPFLNMKGLPVAYGLEDIRRGIWRLPLGYTADGQQDSNPVNAWTGSLPDGSAGTYDCEHWSSASSTSFGVATSSPTEETVDDDFSFSCDREAALLCFSTQNEAWPLSLRHERSGKLTYLVETEPNIVLSQADEACAQSKPEETADVVAWFGGGGSDAVCRLLGRDGRIADNCGGEAIDWSVGPWVRADGYVVAEQLDDLRKGLRAPIMLGADGTFVPPPAIEIVRTDTFASGAAVVTPGQCVVGDRTETSASWTYATARSCANFVSTRTFVYCFER
jgi:hypothetical protein